MSFALLGCVLHTCQAYPQKGRGQEIGRVKSTMSCLSKTARDSRPGEAFLKKNETRVPLE